MSQDLEAALEAAPPAALREALQWAIDVLEAYARECQDLDWVHTRQGEETPTRTFCQGRYFRRALPHIQTLLERTPPP